MIGAVAGDIIGSVYEFHPTKSEDFPLFSDGSTFTDDTVLTIATADAILEGGSYAGAYREWGLRHPDLSYGSLFRQWLGAAEPAPYGSYGSGAAMRVSPVGWAFDTLADVLAEAERSASVTHDHPEGVSGAQAVAACVFLARTGASKDDIRGFLAERFGHRLHRTLAEIRPAYRFDETCQGSVPEAVTAFLEAGSYEDAVRKAVSLGGDADTLACIAGGIAEAFYGGVPETILKVVLSRLTLDLGAIVGRFHRVFGRVRVRGRPSIERTRELGHGAKGESGVPGPRRDSHSSRAEDPATHLSIGRITGDTFDVSPMTRWNG